MNSHRSLFAFCLVPLSLAAGCAGTTPAEAVGDQDAEWSAPPRPKLITDIFVKGTALGTGCPVGTSDVSAAETYPWSEKSVSALFSEYEAYVDPGQALAVVDCTVAVDVKVPRGKSFAVSKLYRQGYAILEAPGMSVSRSVKTYFMGNPLGAAEHAEAQRGPMDDSYVDAPLQRADLVWSPCGVDRQLNVQTRIELKNNEEKSGRGYANTSSVDLVEIVWRDC